MTRFAFQDKNLQGKIIEQKQKDGYSVEVDGQDRFCGHRFLLKTKLYGDKRCRYCGKWFHWKDTDYFTWIREKNIDIQNLDKVLEPLHCGSGHCKDFHHAWLMEIERRREIAMQKDGWKLFEELKNRGVIK